MDTGESGSGDMTIPKVIVYGWFGGNPKPELVLRCIDSWRAFCPDYEIVELNDELVTDDAPRWVREAYAAKKWAFVADYYRMAHMFEHGGVSLDADVELLRSLDQFLFHDFFSGQEVDAKVLITATMGSVPRHPFVGMVLDYYRLMAFNGQPNTKFITKLIQTLEPRQMSGGIMTFPRGVLYPAETFCPYNHRRRFVAPTRNTFAVHHFQGSWLNRGKSLAH